MHVVPFLLVIYCMSELCYSTYIHHSHNFPKYDMMHEERLVKYYTLTHHQ